MDPVIFQFLQTQTYRLVPLQLAGLSRSAVLQLTGPEKKENIIIWSNEDVKEKTRRMTHKKKIKHNNKKVIAG